jgi:hypothetical protein
MLVVCRGWLPMGRAEMECLAIYALFVGLVVGWLVIYGLMLLRRKMQEPQPDPFEFDDLGRDYHQRLEPPATPILLPGDEQ